MLLGTRTVYGSDLPVTGEMETHERTFVKSEQSQKKSRRIQEPPHIPPF